MIFENILLLAGCSTGWEFLQGYNCEEELPILHSHRDLSCIRPTIFPVGKVNNDTWLNFSSWGICEGLFQRCYIYQAFVEVKQHYSRSKSNGIGFVISNVLHKSVKNVQ